MSYLVPQDNLYFRAEKEHRKKNKDIDLYPSYAGPYDIALIKLDKHVTFKMNEVWFRMLKSLRN